jgi:hypothetical protein
MHLKIARLVDVIAVGLGSLTHCLATLLIGEYDANV